MASVIQMLAAFAAYSSLHFATLGIQSTGGMSNELAVLERWKPAWSWGLTIFALNGYAPVGAKLIAGFHGLAVVVGSSSSNRNELHRRYLMRPGLASVVALAASSVLPPCSGAVALTLVLLHVASLVQELVWRMTLPSPLITHLVDAPALQARLLAAGRGFEAFTVASTDTPGVVLSCAMAHAAPEQVGRPPRVLLYLGGNGELWEHGLPGIAGLARRVGATAVALNYRGVGTSTGVPRRADNLVADAADVVGHLLRTTPGLEQRDIVLFGHSIGGGVAIQVLRRYPECGIVLDRTFSSLPDAAHGLVGVPPALARPVYRLAFGLLDSGAAFDRIGHDRRLVTYHQEDRIIRYAQASLARLPDLAVGGRHRRYVVELTGPSPDPHNCDIQDLMGSAEALHRITSFYRP